jgi:Outer membrane protein beta-barrel domain
MEHFSRLKTIAASTLSGLSLLLGSCDVTHETNTYHNMTLQGSIDKANLSESGASKISYNALTRENVIAWTDVWIFDYPLPGWMVGQNETSSFAGTIYDSLGAKPAKMAGLSIKPGIEYIGKGAKFPGGGGNPSLKLNYLEIPIDILYHLPVGAGDLHGGLGPYFAEGLGGGGPNGIYGQNAGGFKRFDAGLNLNLGYRFDNGVAIDLGYDLGLANVEYASQDVSGHTRTLSINLGYQIGRLFSKK